MYINFRCMYRCFSSNSIDVALEVRNALKNRKPIIALESAVVTHGLPYPHNVDTALEMEKIIKSNDVVPATIGVIDGRVKVGMTPEQLNILGMDPKKKTVKVSRRDFPYVLSQGLNGGTTVSGTLVVAKSLGIKFFVTGGIGGVHRDGQNSLDISADLLELSRCAIMVISAGVKSILDIGRTLEYLETVGVCVASYNSKGEFPAFYTKESGYKTVCDVTSPSEAAGLLEQCQNTDSGVLLAVPIPEEKIQTDIDLAVENALQLCNKQGITGKNVTPFILSEVSRVTKGVSMESNILLLKNNAMVGSKIAMEYYSKMSTNYNGPWILSQPTTHKKKKNSPVVIGGSNVDYVLQVKEDLKLDGRMLAGDLQRACGGVGRNLADALGLFGHDICFLSVVGTDFNGELILSSLGHVKTDKMLLTDKPTSWCMVLHSEEGDCVSCIGDMSCHQQITVDMIKKNVDSLYQSPLVVLDGNVGEDTMRFVIEFCNEENIPVYFEPTDIAVAAKPFNSDAWKGLSFISPNIKELQCISDVLKGQERVSYPVRVSVNGGGGDGEFDVGRDIMNSSKDVVCKLISHIPVIMVTLGDKGLLMATKQSDDTVSMVHFPPAKPMSPVSVSGAGDCLCAGYISGILQGKPQEECVAIGLRAATRALMSHLPVPPSLIHNKNI
ncbi:uncharacterized protein LOC126842473 isoform X2 [Adelges cooleyi]|uniref:uncharacterized protein LOC126842473 isoform X2 n=1 Tax=Adelges cooleyi TaxID=133065 RepID=UPI00217F92CF|nr:uncharacterized protein LOC126842473 isoform X2 [Adelges cooleyi]